MSVPPDVLSLVRKFSANGYKYLFRRGDNVADLLRWREPDLSARIDFSAMQVQPDTFSPDFAALAQEPIRSPMPK